MIEISCYNPGVFFSCLLIFGLLCLGCHLLPCASLGHVNFSECYTLTHTQGSPVILVLEVSAMMGELGGCHHLTGLNSCIVKLVTL